MILIIGGAYQGKLEFAERLVKDEPAGPVIRDFQDLVRQWSLEGADIPARIDEVLSENPEAVILMNEVGCGIVPMSPEERAYRENAGLAGQILARRAEKVYRVMCGIGKQIK